MPKFVPLAFLLLAPLSALAASRLTTLSGRYDPCFPTSSRIKLGGTINIGLAYLPGDLSQWYSNPTDSSTLLSPCDGNNMGMLANAGAFVGVFRPRTSRMAVLKSTLYEQIQVWESAKRANASLPDLMSLVAFSGSVTSKPRYVRIGSDPQLATLGLTKGGSGVVSSLALVAYFSIGKLKYLQWHDVGCADCGGKKGKYCAEGVACAADLDGCYEVLAGMLNTTAAATPATASPSTASTGGTPVAAAALNAATPTPAAGGLSGPSGASLNLTAAPAAPAANISAGGVLDRLASGVEAVLTYNYSDITGGSVLNSTEDIIRSVYNTSRTYIGQYDFNISAVLSGAGSQAGKATETSCGTSLNVAFGGTDAKGRVFSSSAQLLRLNQYSVERLYTDVFTAAKRFFNSSGGEDYYYD